MMMGLWTDGHDSAAFFPLNSPKHLRWRHMVRNTRATRKLLAILSLASCLIQLPAPAVARDQLSATQEQRLLKLYTEGKCDQAWRELWKDARQGNDAALERLASQFFGGLYPPSYFPATKDGLGWYAAHNSIALMLYARKSFSEELRKNGMVADPLIDLMGGYYEPGAAEKVRSVNKCFMGKSALDTCYNLAVKYKLIPTFEQYVVLIDNAPRPAFCPPSASIGHQLPTDEELGLGKAAE